MGVHSAIPLDTESPTMTSNPFFHKKAAGMKGE